MKHVEEDRSILETFAEDFVRAIGNDVKYAIVSGFVAIAHGRSRGTEDVDIIVEKVSKDAFKEMHARITKAGFECIQSGDPEELYDDYLSGNLSIRYVRKGGHLPQMEFKLSRDPLDEYQLKTRKKLPFTGTGLYFSSIEMNIAFKEELLKTQKDIDDADHLRLVYKNGIDEKEVERIKSMIRRFRLK
jgi:hypothetical protein